MASSNNNDSVSPQTGGTIPNFGQTYHLSHPVPSVHQFGVSSITLSRLPDQPIFYIVHPQNARYRADIPAQYYITSFSPGQIGNIRLSKTSSKKQGFKALLSPAKSAVDNPLLNGEDTEEVLFEIKATGWTGGRYQWTGSDGELLAVEDVDGDETQPRLVGQVPLPIDSCDALVAVWILRLWLDRAESRQAKRAWFESMTDPNGHRNSAADLSILCTVS
ncbi:hypothetical protein PHISP_05474 [Aspergillus sp. HF37]|nr:hypothetical protein PHISP_05474 [Aspergillus sp. HF37]